MGRDAGSTQIAYSAEHFYLALLDKEYYEEIKAYAIKEWTVKQYSLPCCFNLLILAIDREYSVRGNVYAVTITG